LVFQSGNGVEGCENLPWKNRDRTILSITESPQLPPTKTKFMGVMRETTSNYATALYVIAGLTALSILLPIIVPPTASRRFREDPRTFGLTRHLAPPRD